MAIANITFLNSESKVFHNTGLMCIGNLIVKPRESSTVLVGVLSATNDNTLDDAR